MGVHNPSLQPVPAQHKNPPFSELLAMSLATDKRLAQQAAAQVAGELLEADDFGDLVSAETHDAVVGERDAAIEERDAAVKKVDDLKKSANAKIAKVEGLNKEANDKIAALEAELAALKKPPAEDPAKE